MKIAYLGPKDSYSYLAASGFLGDGVKLCEYPTITNALLSVGNGCDAAFVPYENSSEGTVSDTIDTLIKEKLFIVREYDLKIDNRLITLKGAELSKIKKIVTHRQPYGQCRGYISQNYKTADIVFCDSTSAAAAVITDNYTAAIGGLQLLKSNSHLAASDFTINDQKENRTRFILVSDKAAADKQNDRTTVVFESENKPGGLLSLLSVFEKYNINLTKIESRPRKESVGRYLFIVDITGGAADENISLALKEIESKTVFYKYLGSYFTGFFL